MNCNVKKLAVRSFAMLALCAALVAVVIVTIGSDEVRAADPKILVYHDDLKSMLANVEHEDEYPYQDCDANANYGSVNLQDYDVVFIKDDIMDSSEKTKLLDYLDNGGRLYMINGDISALDGELRERLDVTINEESITVNDVDVRLEELDGTIGGGGTAVNEHYSTGVDSYLFMRKEDGNDEMISALTVDDDPVDGYRMIYTGLDILNMVDDDNGIDGDSHYMMVEFLEGVMVWFTEENINHNPVVNLDSALLESGEEITLFSEFDEDGHCLEWRNADVDPWDQQISYQDPDAFEYMSFDVYVSMDRGLVENGDADALMNTTGREFFAPGLDESGHYYVKVVATDRFGATAESQVGEFLYDGNDPVVEWVRPVSLEYDDDEVVDVTVGDPIGSDPSPSAVTVFGKCFRRPPDYIAINLTDDHGIKMAGNSITVIETKFSSTYGSPATGQDFEILVFPGSDINGTELYNNMDARTVDMENDPYDQKLALNEENDLTVFIAPPLGFANRDGSLPDGWYAISVEVRDHVRNEVYCSAIFQVDYNEPVAATNFEIGIKDYVSPESDVFLEENKTNYFTFKADTFAEDPTLNLVEFQMSKGTKNYDKVDNPYSPEIEASNWVTVHTWSPVNISEIEDRTYNFTWYPSALYDSIRVVTWDRANNYNISNYFNDFIIDAEAPIEPSDISHTIDGDQITLEGKAMDGAGGSGISHVEILLENLENPITVEDLFDEDTVTAKPGVNPSGFFKVRFQFDPDDYEGANLFEVLRIRAADNVGNVGPLWENYVTYDFASHYNPALNPSPISFTDDSQSNPSIHGSVVAWQDDRNGDWDIFMFDLDNPDEILQISNTSAEMAGGEYETHMQTRPLVSGSKIIWLYEWWDFSDHEYYIRIYDCDDPVQGGELLFDIGTSPLSIDFSGNWIIWTDLADGGGLFNPFALFTYNIETGVQSELMNFGGDAALYGDKLLYVDEPNSQTIGKEKTIFKIHNLTTDTVEQDITFLSKPTDVYDPAFFGEYIASEDHRLDESGLFEDGNTDIYLMDLEREKIAQVTVDESAQEEPVVRGDYIVWTDKRSGKSAVYAYSISANKYAVICENDTGNIDPRVHGEFVVWENEINWSSSTVYIYDLTDAEWLDSPAVFSDLDIEEPSGNEMIEIVITSHSNGNKVSGVVIIAGTASNPVGSIVKVEISINNGNWFVVNGTGSWEYSWNATGLENGDFEFRVRAFDGQDYSGTQTLQLKLRNAGGTTTDDDDDDDFTIAGMNGIMVMGGASTLIAVLIAAMVLARSRKGSEGTDNPGGKMDAPSPTQTGTAQDAVQPSTPPAVTPPGVQQTPQQAAAPPPQFTQMPAQSPQQLTPQSQPFQQFQQPAAGGMQQPLGATLPQVQGIPQMQTMAQPIPAAAQQIPQTPQPAATPVQQQMPQDTGWQCRKCGSTMESHFKFCTGCGTQRAG